MGAVAVIYMSVTHTELHTQTAECMTYFPHSLNVLRLTNFLNNDNAAPWDVHANQMLLASGCRCLRNIPPFCGAPLTASSNLSLNRGWEDVEIRSRHVLVVLVLSNYWQLRLPNCRVKINTGTILLVIILARPVDYYSSGNLIGPKTDPRGTSVLILAHFEYVPCTTLCFQCRIYELCDQHPDLHLLPHRNQVCWLDTTNFSGYQLIYYLLLYTSVVHLSNILHTTDINLTDFSQFHLFTLPKYWYIIHSAILLH